MPANVENDHRNISRIVGSVWREMTNEEKDPWVQMAETEKKLHAEIYPGYRYTPSVVPLGRKPVKDGDEIAGAENDGVEVGTGGETKEVEPAIAQEQDIRSARRSSSCPPVQSTASSPPSTKAQNQSQIRAPRLALCPMPRSYSRRRPYPLTAERSYDFRNPNQRIDPMCRVSRAYEAHAQFYVGQNQNQTQDQYSILTNQPLFRHRRSSSWPPPTSPISASATDLGSPPPQISIHQKNRRAFARDLDLDHPPLVPVLHGGPYAIAPPGDAPGWDCAPAPPLQWGDWVGAGGRVDWEGWEGWEGMIVDDRQGVFDIPNDMNFPAAEFQGHTPTAVFSESPVRAHPTSTSTPKLQPLALRGAHFQPVFTNPFAAQPPLSTDGVRDLRREAEGTALPGAGVAPNSRITTLSSNVAAFDHHDERKAGNLAYSDPVLEDPRGRNLKMVDGGNLNVWHFSDMNEHESLRDSHVGDDGEEEEGEGEDMEFEISSMFPRMSLDADADAEGESESEDGERVSDV